MKTKLEAVRERAKAVGIDAFQADKDRAFLLKLIDDYEAIITEVDTRFAVYLHVHGKSLDSEKAAALRKRREEME